MTDKPARYVRDLDGWRGNAKLYELSEPLDEHKFVAVSAVDAMFSGPETYSFGCDADGNNVDFCELPGSFRGDFDHERALRGAGYEPVLPAA